jgi:hypothetical protein
MYVFTTFKLKVCLGSSHEAVDHAFYCRDRRLCAARDCYCVSERLRAMRRAKPALLPRKTIKLKWVALAGISHISSIHLKLENANILLVSDESLISARHALLKCECEDAVIENVSNGGIVCQTRSVLEADVIFEIKYDDAVSIGERAKLTSEAAAKLNLDARQGADNRISGHQLFFGVKLAPKPIMLGSDPGSNLGEMKCTVLKK